MSKILFAAILLSTAAFGQYKLDKTGNPPSELAPEIQAALEKEAHRILKSDGSVFCELWFRTKAPDGPGVKEQGVSLTSIPHGALLGAIRFHDGGQDRRGQAIEAGVYTLRFSLFPPDGNHQGVAAQRDFLLLVPAADDKDLNATPSYKEVVAMSKKSTGGGHPAILSFWKDETGHEPGLEQEGDFDWILYTKIGDIPIGVIVAGMFMG